MESKRGPGSSRPPTRDGNRRGKLIKNPWDTFLGDCSVIDKYLIDKPLAGKWFIAHFLNVLLRSVGQLAFVNNPIGGLLVVGVLFARQWEIAVGTLLGGAVATIAEMVLMLQDWNLMRSGVAPFNGALIGAVLQSLSLNLLQKGSENKELQPEMLGFIALGSLASLYLCTSLNNFLSRVTVPYLALPFNLVAICSMMVLKNSRLNHSLLDHNSFNQTHLSDQTLSAVNSSTTELEIKWEMAFQGVLNSFGQIWGLNNDMIGSGFFVMAIFIGSPLTMVSGILGALTGTLGAITIAVLLPVAKGHEVLEEVYCGVWGFQCILSMASLTCVFFAFNHASFSLGLVNCGATIFTHYGLREVLGQHGLPVFTLPFTLCTMLLILTTDERAQLGRIHEAMGYPERHAYRRYTLTRQSRQEAERVRKAQGEQKEMKDVSSKLMDTQNP